MLFLFQDGLILAQAPIDLEPSSNLDLDINEDPIVVQAAVTVPKTRPIPPPNAHLESQLAYSAFVNGQWDIFAQVLPPTTLPPQALTQDSYEDRDPSYAPDGQRLAYASRRDNNWDIYLLDLSSGQETRLTDEAHYDGRPVWHPDGQQLVFESYRSGSLDIWLMDLTKPASMTNLSGRLTHG